MRLFAWLKHMPVLTARKVLAALMLGAFIISVPLVGVRYLSPEQVDPNLQTPLERVGVARRKATPILLRIDGHEAEIYSPARSVLELLNEQSIALTEMDQLSVPATAPLLPGMRIQVTRRREYTTVRQAEIPFETIRQDDPTLTLGQTRVVQDGTAGIKEITERTVVEDGQQIGAQLLRETVVDPPAPRIVAHGTLGVVSRDGRQYRYSRELTMSATGYTAGKESNPNGNGYTYTGIKATRGVVAVDPRVIPLGTRVYVEGYGPAIAADIGGAIKGNKIDLCFTTVAEAIQWGVRPVTVYILSDS